MSCSSVHALLKSGSACTTNTHVLPTMLTRTHAHNGLLICVHIAIFKQRMHNKHTCTPNDADAHSRAQWPAHTCTHRCIQAAHAQQTHMYSQRC
eukprot:1160568-Pelagomonas_calceolata.AAC.7